MVIFAATPRGRQAAEDWLDTPVAHVRDIRSHLLLKLALLDRTGADPADLLRRQRAVLEPIARAIESGQPAGDGFDATLLAWRRATAAAALEFLDAVAHPELALVPAQAMLSHWVIHWRTRARAVAFFPSASAVSGNTPSARVT